MIWGMMRKYEGRRTEDEGKWGVFKDRSVRIKAVAPRNPGVLSSSFVLRPSSFPSPLAAYQAISYALLGALAIIGATNLRTLERRRRANPLLPMPPPLVSILVPARDEERNIGTCVASLAAQVYPTDRFEILVLDDRSGDRTGAIVAALAAEHPIVRLLRGAALPDGWGGKAHACQQLADAARGDWLLFTDADTVHAPGMLRATMAAALMGGVEALTALPRERADSFGERLLVPQLFFFLLASQPLAPLERAGETRFVFANGQFLLVGRELYRRIGGHAAVRAQLMEDMALGLRCKRAGARILLLDGGDWLSCRMYDGFPATWRGFVRSLQAGNRLAPTFLLGIGAMTILFFAGPFVVLLALLLGGRRGRPLALAVGQVLALLGVRAIVGRGLRQPAREIALFPVGVFVLAAAVLHTLWRALRGRRIEWRGRGYDLPDRP
jgi:chlorobactene glucosyltransferase